MKNASTFNSPIHPFSSMNAELFNKFSTSSQAFAIFIWRSSSELLMYRFTFPIAPSRQSCAERKNKIKSTKKMLFRENLFRVERKKRGNFLLKIVQWCVCECMNSGNLEHSESTSTREPWDYLNDHLSLFLQSLQGNPKRLFQMTLNRRTKSFSLWNWWKAYKKLLKKQDFRGEHLFQLKCKHELVENENWKVKRFNENAKLAFIRCLNFECNF